MINLNFWSFSVLRLGCPMCQWTKSWQIARLQKSYLHSSNSRILKKLVSILIHKRGKMETLLMEIWLLLLAETNLQKLLGHWFLNLKFKYKLSLTRLCVQVLTLLTLRVEAMMRLVIAVNLKGISAKGKMMKPQVMIA